MAFYGMHRGPYRAAQALKSFRPSRDPITSGRGWSDLFSFSAPVGPKRPNRRPDVIKLQTLLMNAGDESVHRTDGPTGFFGPVEEEAVKNFQFKNNLVTDGILNPSGPTYDVLRRRTNKIIGAAPPPSVGDVEEHHRRLAQGNSPLLRLQNRNGQQRPLGVRTDTVKRENGPASGMFSRRSDPFGPGGGQGQPGTPGGSAPVKPGGAGIISYDPDHGPFGPGTGQGQPGTPGGSAPVKPGGAGIIPYDPDHGPFGPGAGQGQPGTPGGPNKPEREEKHAPHICDHREELIKQYKKEIYNLKEEYEFNKILIENLKIKIEGKS